MTIFCIRRADPRGLDRLAVEAVLLPFFEVRAQPTGAAGAADWRLAGRLGRVIKEGRFTGREGESVLMPTMGRFDAQRIFLIGLGVSYDNHDEVVRQLTKAASVLFEAGGKDVAVAPPTPANAGVVTAAGWWIDAIAKSGRAFVRVALLDADGALSSGQSDLAERCRAAGLEFDAKGHQSV